MLGFSRKCLLILGKSTNMGITMCLSSLCWLILRRTICEQKVHHKSPLHKGSCFHRDSGPSLFSSQDFHSTTSWLGISLYWSKVDCFRRTYYIYYLRSDSCAHTKTFLETSFLATHKQQTSHSSVRAVICAKTTNNWATRNSLKGTLLNRVYVPSGKLKVRFGEAA